MSAATNTFVRSASYAPCPSCNEGSLTWDHDHATSRCDACGALDE